MLDARYKLSSKIVGILMLYFFVALAAIGMTLHVSTQLDGGAAAINDAGSQRMRTYRLAYLVSQFTSDPREQRALAEEVRAEIDRFERVFAELEHGNPARPLFLPREAEVIARMADLKLRWTTQIKPMILKVQAAEGHDRQEALMRAYRPMIEQFVGGVNDLVVRVEESNSRNTALLRSYQLGLLVLAVVGTTIIIFWFLVTVIRPVTSLREGIRRMAGADFSVRLPVETRDEFGELAHGFNEMAGRLENLYGTLEQRVEEKTSRLAEKNEELALLYEIAAFLNEPASVEELCRGFLKRVIGMTGAEGGAVRLVDADARTIHLVSHEGLSQSFAAKEASLGMGECVCGEAAQRGAPVTWNLDRPGERSRRYHCEAEGFRTVAAFVIHHQKQLVGVFNLYFRDPRDLSGRETQLLETLARHLGMAIENQRLVSREKEMAVSEERNLLAQELHDSIAQSLAFLNIQSQLLEGSLARSDVAEARGALASIREGIQESYDHVRELLVHFRTRMRQADLSEAIRVALEKFEGQTGIVTAFRQTGGGIPFAPDIEPQVLHIVQEALSNVRKHSRARHVTVEIARGRDGPTVSVRDDGIGFDPAQEGVTEMHMGLKIMRERAHRIGARLDIRSSAGQGAEVRLVLPRREQEAV